MEKILGFLANFIYNITMRVISGKYKGKMLTEFSLGTTRPTSDMIREALFDKIGFKIVDAIFLDLFSGTGACGIEAISRNAQKSFFVDQNKDAIKIINKNIQIVGAENYQVVCADYFEALKNFSKQNIKFDIVFLDPPYASDFAEKAIQALLKNELLKDDFLIIWEHDKTKLDYVEKHFTDSKTKKYGDKFLTYLMINNFINIQ